jgi:hypothetical protein
MKSNKNLSCVEGIYEKNTATDSNYNKTPKPSDFSLQGITTYYDNIIRFSSGFVFDCLKNTLTKLNPTENYIEKLLEELE